MAVVILALILWYVSSILCVSIWIMHIDYNVMFWPGLLMFTPIVNTVFLFILVKKFVPTDFFSINKLTDALKNK